MRMQKNIFVVAFVASALLAACTATAPTKAAAPDLAASGPPPGTSGKLSPDMVGKVSPVPAFMGQGEYMGKQWTIHVRSEGQMRHSVQLVWKKDHVRRYGDIFYRGTPGPSRGAPITLDGALDTPQGRKTIRIDITTAFCTDGINAKYPQRVVISVQGEPDLQGCGELAVY